MTPETTSSLAALNQALEKRDAEIAALKAELATVTNWGRMAYTLIKFVSGVGGWSASSLLDDAPTAIAATPPSTDTQQRGEAATPPGGAEHDVGFDTD